MKELIEIQNELKVLKDQTNKDIKFNYRTCDQIFQEVKPLCKQHNVLLTVSDDIVNMGDRYYIKATAIVKNSSGESVQASGFAREPDKLMSMSYPQITGSCSSYARKTAMGGLFNLDDNNDPDSGNNDDEKPEDKKKTNKLTPNHFNLLTKCVSVLETNGFEPNAKGLQAQFNKDSDDSIFEHLYNTACGYVGEKIKL